MSKEKSTLYVMEMSEDQDIRNTQLDPAWGAVAARYDWDRIKRMDLAIPGGAAIIVIAHGNDGEIGNAVHVDGRENIDIDAGHFLAMVQANMAYAEHPESIYISACGRRRIAMFAFNVRIEALNNDIWHNTSILGHGEPVSGPVPPPNDVRWDLIYGPGQAL